MAPAVIDLEAAKWVARENGYEEDAKEENAHMRRFKAMLHSKKAVYVRDFGLIALLLGWWIPAIVNDTPQVRHRWIPSTVIVSTSTDHLGSHTKSPFPRYGSSSCLFFCTTRNTFLNVHSSESSQRLGRHV
jgi:hypothetical protein